MVLEHRLLIFVYRLRAGGCEYLFERRHPVAEFAWTPIPAMLGPSDSFESAMHRSMRDEWHAPPPERLLDLRVCGHFAVGDVELVDWGVGYGVRPNWEPRAARPGDEADLAWRPLPHALALLDADEARRALVRLHLDAASS